ncbi:MAG: FKBP-type peptidyl-prolyl cis-trans isomerase [Muribaculaceae bacterium]|nr:FKBP-type peptidyl-prolyl cis-trans isomerase [Muribaculaceae bacterium]MDE5845608.1 FKBP-type peptidyl-prolyl cis-trans isomerase [Muribaculaceae bacterium]MDE5858687.1 FKBP-type peptidyl-prolyl cis-trans isomerase [Muribaculaceae bacterium]MDE7155264.1 FKBP-type peptidyl-prolyl cis-trans isomerase [Muribaculaceae bacterium]MDE7369794.1 FKBP-type peptidyl-prolyl cis-trans isomerase [Muribaculaceae bacterium]
MRKILFWILCLPLTFSFIACDDDNDNDTYKEWREENVDYINKEASRLVDGKNYYKRIVPGWNSALYVLIHYFNNTEETAGNLVPLETSTVAVKYKGMLYDGTPFDSSYVNTDSLFITKVTGVISGWQIALQEMHVGDSVDVIIPYQAAYGVSGSGSIPPYSTLKFGIKLVDIPNYETR